MNEFSWANEGGERKGTAGDVLQRARSELRNRFKTCIWKGEKSIIGRSERKKKKKGGKSYIKSTEDAGSRGIEETRQGSRS